MTSISEKNKNRKPYAAPKLKVIDLAADEVLAIGCKLDTTGQAAYGNFNRCRLPRRCSNLGS